LTWSLDGRPLRSVLVTRLRYLGDIAMSTVVPEVLKQGDADLDIGFLCEAAYADLLTAHPSLDRVHALTARRRGSDAARRRAHNPPPLTRGKGTWQVVRQIRRQRYDLTVDLFFNPRSALLVRWGGTRFRIGGSRGWRRRLYTHSVQPPERAAWPSFWAVAPGGLGDHLSRLAPLRHEESGQPFLTWCGENLTRHPLRPCVAVPSLTDTVAAQELASLGIPANQEYILLAPGATWASKQWPVQHWATLTRALAAHTRLPLVVLAPPGGDGRYEAVADSLPAGQGGMLPDLALGDALRVVGRAALVISVDSGIMHAAVAMGRPTVALFGPTSPEIWFPYPKSGSFRVLATRPACHPCDRLVCDEFICLPDLTPATVADTVAELLAAGGTATSEFAATPDG
jgi:ADP-heptose:LPS heptosyltransferase